MNIAHWTNLILKKLESWLTALIKMLPNIILAAIVLTAAFFIAKLIKKISYKIILRISASDTVSSVVSTLLQTLIIILAITVALGILNLQTAVSSLLAGVGIIGLALGFAFQDLSSNFISGLFMAFKRPFEIGEKVETNAFTGTIEEIKLRSTTLITTSGLNVSIPNKEIFQKPIINYSRSENRRVELDFAITNSTDLGFAESMIRKAIENIEGVSDVQFYYTSVDDPKIKLSVSFRIDNTVPKGFMSQRHKAIVSIYKAFAENGIVKVAIPEGAKPEKTT